MIKFSAVAIAASVVAFMAESVNAATEDTARVNARVAPMIQIGGSSAPGDPDDPANGGEAPEHNTFGGVIGGIAYGQTYDTTRSNDASSFMATGSWLVHSNSQVNRFACAGTDLYKGAVNPAFGGDYNTLPIPLDDAAGVQITASLSNDLSGQQGYAPLSGPEIPDSSNSNWVFKQSGFVTFHGAQQQVTQWVSCKLTWTNTDLEKSQGIYVGYMRIYAINADGF